MSAPSTYPAGLGVTSSASSQVAQLPGCGSHPAELYQHPIRFATVSSAAPFFGEKWTAASGSYPT